MWGLALPSTVGADGIRVVLVRRFGVRVDDCPRDDPRGARNRLHLRARDWQSSDCIILRLLTLPVRCGSRSSRSPCGVLALADGHRRCSCSRSAAPRSTFRACSLFPRRNCGQQSRAGCCDRLHEAYRSLAFDRPRLCRPSAALTFLEQMLMVACYGLIAVTLGVEFNPLFLLCRRASRDSDLAPARSRSTASASMRASSWPS